jgi:nicotinamidase/pyrazinamidase
MKSALLLVDLQNDFMPTGTLPVPAGDEVIPLANTLQDYFECVVATQDWHPRHHGSFAGNHPGLAPGDRVALAGLTQILWPTHCVQGTPGAEWATGLKTDRIEKVFQKGVDSHVDSYSGFFDNGHQKATGLSDYLLQRQISELFIMGLALDYCVKYTVLDACQLGFKTFLIEDACRGVNPEACVLAIEEMQAAGAYVIRSAAIKEFTR